MISHISINVLVRKTLQLDLMENVVIFAEHSLVRWMLRSVSLTRKQGAFMFVIHMLGGHYYGNISGYYIWRYS